MVLALLLLGACKTDEEAAAEHFEKALAYVEAGDEARARVEFLNTLSRRPNHFEARLAYAGLLEEAGDEEAAYAQYKRVSDQVPDHLPTLLTLSEMAMLSRDWDAARRYTDMAAALVEDDAGVAARQAVMAYADASAEEDAARREAVHRRLLGLREKVPELLPMHHAVVDGYIRSERPGEALEALDRALEAVPDDRFLLTARVQLLYQLDRRAEIAPHLTDMLEVFPESQPLREMLADWYIEIGDTDAAEATLRAMHDKASTEAQLALIRFLAEHRGQNAALAELDALIDGEAATSQFRLLRSAIRYDTGRTAEAIADVREVLETLREEGEAETDALLMLAQMLDGIGQRVEAEEVLRSLLTAAPRHVQAAQLLGSWLLERGQPEGALQLLSAARAVRPEDPDTLRLLARAYAATDRPELARRAQADAFATSGYAPDQALYYALLLTEAGNESAAIEVLTTALARAPRSEALLTTLGDHYRIAGNLEQAEQIERRLRAVGTEGALLAAERIRFDRLVAESDIELALRYLDMRGNDGDVSAFSFASIARSNLAAGHLDRADAVIDLGLKRFPDNRDLRLAAAALALARDEAERAIEVYRELISETPGVETLWVELLRIHQRQEDVEAVDSVIKAGLEANPDSDLLRWESAMNDQAQGREAAAVATYEALLADHPESAPVRNNLAVLLSREPGDEADLARAAEVAAPLAGSPVPQFLDTYGWIQFRLGAFELAETALEAAAEALPDNAEVRFHAGEAMAAVGRTEVARGHYEAVLRLGADGAGGFAEAAAASLASLPESAGESN